MEIVTIDSLMDETQPVILEKKRFESHEKSKLLHFEAISVPNVSDVRKVFRKIIFEWCSEITKLFTMTLM